ncbi:MAG: Uma2 family endonuclease [Bryobacteraceae bacterium]
MIATRTPSVDEWIAEHGDRCEFVRGEAMEKPLPKARHGKAQMNLGTDLNLYARRTGQGVVISEWHHAFGPPDDIRIYIPDLAFVLPPRHLDVPECPDQASDIMIEIASPNQGAELADKIEFYLHNGAKRVWLVDPQRRRIGIYSPDASPRSIEANGVLTDDLLPGFELPLASIFD